MPRGGRRPGAGAPKGNWNALSSGHRSKRLQTLVLTLRDDPQFVVVYRLLMAASSRKQRQAKQSMRDIVEAMADAAIREKPLDGVEAESQQLN